MASLEGGSDAMIKLRDSKTFAGPETVGKPDMV